MRDSGTPLRTRKGSQIALKRFWDDRREARNDKVRTTSSLVILDSFQDPDLRNVSRVKPGMTTSLLSFRPALAGSGIP
jgi:hypothetical protein